jgi:hypothetical protein
MTLRFDWFHAPPWLARAHVNRAMTFVLGVIGVSVLFGALRVLDVAFSGALHSARAVASATAASGAVLAPDVLLRTEPTASGAQPIEVDEGVPSAFVEAISL